MEVRVSRVHSPITTLGFGRRLGIWFQGCSIQCPGCVSRDTWERDGGKLIDVEALLRSIEGEVRSLDGVTLSGGEPFDQPEALEAILMGLRGLGSGDVLVFSGYPMERLEERFPEIRRLPDVLITDPFRENAGAERILRGSDNQRVFLQSDLARERYPADMNEMTWGTERRLDVDVSGENVWMVGIPARGMLDKIRERMAEKGWRLSVSDQVEVRA